MITLENSIDQSSDFTIFVSFKHESLGLNALEIGIWDETNNRYHFPLWQINLNHIIFNKGSNQLITKALPNHIRGKQMMINAIKEGDYHKIYLNGKIDFMKEFFSSGFNSKTVVIKSQYYVQRIGLKTDSSIVNSQEFKRILYFETLNGMEPY